jgi:hypothetical protein
VALAFVLLFFLWLIFFWSSSCHVLVWPRCPSNCKHYKRVTRKLCIIYTVHLVTVSITTNKCSR